MTSQNMNQSKTTKTMISEVITKLEKECNKSKKNKSQTGEEYG